MTKPSRTRERRTWADEKAIPTGVFGETYLGGGVRIPIREENRASVYEYRPAGIQVLLDICRKFYTHNTRKIVDAVVFGIDNGKTIAYAIFVEDNFLRKVTEREDDFTLRTKRGPKNRT